MFILIQRIVDYIPLAIEHELNQALSDNIRNTLIQTLSEDSQNGRTDLADLLNEDPVTAKRRIDLESRINRLQKIMAELDPFEHLEVQDIEVNSVNADLAFWEPSAAYLTGAVLGPSEVYADTPTSWGIQSQSGQRVGKKKRGKVATGNVG